MAVGSSRQNLRTSAGPTPRRRAAESGVPVPGQDAYWMVTKDDVAGAELLVTTGYPAAGAA